MSNTPRTHFDLPRKHLGETGHWVPPKARDEKEIERRRSLKKGQLLQEYETRGLRVGHDVLTHTPSGEGLAFASRMIGMAVLNASWYTFARNSQDVMRRRLILPRMADDEARWRIQPAELKHLTVQGLSTAQELSRQNTDRISQDRLTVRRVRSYGRLLGNVALHLAVLGDGNRLYGGDAHKVQDSVREEALDLLDFSREFAGDEEVYPSVAQLADSDSPLSVYWRRNAPDTALNSLMTATESV